MKWMPKYAKRRDKNEKPIVQKLRDAGCSVLYIDEVDTLVGCRGANYLIEFKIVGRDFDPHQRKFAEEWQGLKPQIAHTWEEAFKIVGLIK